jgi:murein DD-endopeptidase MepM/ murein hydrolase activator NlpD
VNRATGRTGASAATAGHGVAAIWNPHSTLAITVYELSLFATTAPAAGSTVALQRISARGTAGSTITPGIQNDTQYGAAPSSGSLLDLATYTVQPTVIGTSVTHALWRFPLAAVIGSGFVQPFPEGIRVPAGAGLAIIAAAAVIVPASDVSIAFDE